MELREVKDSLSMLEQEQRMKFFRRFLEMISARVVSMDLYWQSEAIDSDVEEFWPTLLKQLEFVDKTIFHCSLFKTQGRYTFSPLCSVEGSRLWEIWGFWEFALLYDVCISRELVYRKHPEDDYKVKGAYEDGRFIGWELTFFDTIEEVEGFIKEHPEYSSYTLYYNFKELPFKYGYYDPLPIYCSSFEFYKHDVSFIEIPDLYFLQVQEKKEYSICQTEEELIDTLGFMVQEFDIEGTNLSCEVKYSTRHKEVKARLIGSTDYPGCYALEEIEV